MGLLRDYYGSGIGGVLPLGLLWDSCEIAIGGIVVGSLLDCCGPWWNCCGIAVVLLLWDCCETAVVLLPDCCVIILVSLWYCCGIPVRVVGLL